MLHARAGRWKCTNLLYFSFTCALHLSAAQSLESVIQWVSCSSMLLPHEYPATWARLRLKNIWPFLSQKPSGDSPTQHATPGGKPTKPWHQINGEAAEAELCCECEQSEKEGGKGCSGVRRWSGKGGGGVGFYISRQAKFLDFRHHLDPPEEFED